MRLRPFILVLLGLLLLAGAWFFWPSGLRLSAQKNKSATPSAAPAVSSTRPASTAPVLFTGKTATNGVARTNQFAWRLSNTPKDIGQLVNDPHAILLANALIDVGRPLNLSIPKHLQSRGEPGTYIVQARGPVDNSFRATLAAAGAQIVSYIPNNAYLVRVASGGAAGLAGQPPVQSVLPYEPYYKISSALIGPAVLQKDLPDNSALTLGLFADNAQATIDQIQQLGGTVVGTDRSPFGPIVRVLPPANWTALATLSGVQIVELAHRRTPANDLARVTLGIATNTVTATNYLGLNGKNITVEMNDTGVYADHPDFSLTGTAEAPGSSPPSRVKGLPSSLVDVNGHGTHVAGIIAGNGSESSTINTTNPPQGSVTGADFRGKAPLAQLYSFAALNDAGNRDIPDYALQVVPATNHALISNNSWNYDDDTYNLAAASYDAAVRDALPLVTGSQPVLFVFSAGNDGGGDSSGGGGTPDTILSPGTAKDVITVGALEQLRFITNSVTNLDLTVSTPWQDATDSGNEVAGYSARGNVGVGTEGRYGRFKPDVVAPGSFVVSTRSAQWDQVAYYNPTNYTFYDFVDQIVEPKTLVYYSLTIPANAVGVAFHLVPNRKSPSPFPPNLPIYVSNSRYPTTTANDFVTVNNQVVIPPDGGGGYLATIQNGGLNFAVGNSTNFPVNYDVITEITTTNELGNYFEVFSNLNETLAPYYRYESGTSMAAPAVSGLAALMQDYFTNVLKAATAPSPALLKALVINGARSQGSYEFAVTNRLNLQGWGLPSVTNSLPYGLTNVFNAGCTSFFLDQSPTNALATGQRQIFSVKVPDITGQAVPLRVTLAWTDPPGNPAAAIKLVNSLELVVTNLDTGEVFFGNDFDGGTPSYSAVWDTNTAPNIDSINNVQNVFLSPLLGQNYSVTVLGQSVNVNAVTAQTNNVVQDFALVISSGNGEVTNAIIVGGYAPAPLAGPEVTYVASTNLLLLNQLAGGNTPLLGTNTVGAGAGYVTNAAITLGMTNQWHFFVVTNRLGYTNAAFITFLSQTLATPRMGVFADPSQNPTQPEADIDLYVAGPSDPNAANLLLLDPNVISNCVNGVFGDSASLANGTGTEFVAYTNAPPNGVYYIGVKSETQVAAEFDFLPVFSLFPFSTTDANGNETVNGLLLPVPIPDGSPAHPGVAYVFALAVQPIQVQDVIVTNDFQSQNFGDLFGVLTHSGKNVVLNNHNSPPPTFLPDIYDFVYDDSPQPVVGSQPPDGPGTLRSFQGQQGAGPWILTAVDNSLTQTSSVIGLTVFLKPHIDLTTGGAFISLAPQTYFYGYIDVPAGATNLTIAATNTTPLPVGPNPFFPGQLYEKLGEQPAPPPTPLTNFDKMMTLTNAGPLGPGDVLTIGPSDLPPIQPGRYFVTLYNPSPSAQTYFVIATIALGQVPPILFGTPGPTNLLDDAVMYSSVFVTNTLPIASLGVGLRVEHPRISDLVFHLISPDGTRYLLMENRGGTSTNGCGVTVVNTNDFSPVSSSGGPAPDTNIVNVGLTSGTVAIDYDFFIAPDEMSVFYQGVKIFDSGLINGNGTFNINYGPGTSTNLTIIMNEFTNPLPSTAWNYTIHSIQTNYYYLTLTDDTNLTTTPIKFAPTPFYGAPLPPPPIPANVQVLTGPMLNPANGHYYYLLQTNNWTGSEAWAEALGGHLATIRNAAENNWILNNLSSYGNVIRDLWIGFYNPTQDTNGLPHSSNFEWVSGEPITYINWAAGEPSNGGGGPLEYYTYMYSSLELRPGFAGHWNDYSDSFTVGNGLFPQNGVAEVIPSFGNAYYLPEQSLDPLVGTSPYGLWQLEIQDDRVGATNHTVLDSWQLQFVFANTNPVPANLGGGVTNFIPPGGTFWVQVDVPTNADFATNILTFATGPLNMWYSTNLPPTITNPPGDVELLAGQIVGSYLLDTNGYPNMVPGGTYYIGLQNPSTTATVQFGFRVDFHLLLPAITNPFAFTQPATAITGTSAQLNGMATPNGAPATAWFEWGTNTLYGNQTPPVNVGAGFNVVYTTGQIFGLITNVPYHFRLVVSNATTVVYGFDQILDEAYVVAWGADYVGQANVPPILSNNVVAIAGAYEHSLALKQDGTAVGWGDNNFGQATVPASLSNLVAVAGGAYYSIALKNNGTVASWGANILGQTNVPAGLNNVITIAGGTYSSLALKNDGSVVAWGAGFFGLTNVPASLSNTVAVAGGSYHSLALKNDGTVTAWGDDSAFQTNVPPDLTNVVAIAAGSYHSLALRYNGTVVAWGDNSAYQTNVPVSLSNVVAIAAGGFNSLALRADGTVVTWGDNTAGQSSVPVGLTNVVAIAAGYLHSLALTPQSIASFTNVVINLTNGVPQTNSISPNGVTYYKVSVPTNADFATNILLFTINGPLNVWFTTNSPPTVGVGNDALLLGGVTNGTSLLNTNASPFLVPGSTYYLGVQNLNLFTVNYGIQVDFHLITATNPPPSTNAVPISGILHTNGGFLLTWFAPSNDLFQVQWTTSLAPAVWTTFTNPPSVGYNTNFPAGPTNAQFNFFDDGSQTGGFGTTRFYRLILLSSGPPPNTAPVLPLQATQTINPLNPLVVTNTATDAQSPPQILTYTLSSSLTGTNLPTINTNGIITWTPDVSQAGTSNLFTTVVTDNGVPPLSATNSFSVIVNPVPGISSVTYSNGGYLITWWAPTNDIFQVQVSTNLASPWWPFTNLVTYTGPLTPTNGLFSYYDDGSQVPFGSLRFYRLKLVGIVPPATTTVPIGSIVFTNGGFLLTWFAPTNDQFNVRWATNLAAPVAWTSFPNIITSTNGVFTFMDTNTTLLMKFYDLLLLP